MPVLQAITYMNMRRKRANGCPSIFSMVAPRRND